MLAGALDVKNSVTPRKPVDNTHANRRRAAVLRAKLRRVTGIRRVRLCAVTKCRCEFGVTVSGEGKARRATPIGVLTCNSVWVCPSCSMRIRARRMSQLSRALRAGLDAHPDHRWQMVTFTARHHDAMPLAWLRKGLMRAFRRMRQSGSVARIMKRRIAGTVRAVEITFSFVNGWHPHIHLGMLTTEWTDDERETLSRVWQECCERELSTAARPDREHGIYWSKKTLRRGDGGTKLEAYLTDIGLELSHVSTKTARRTDSRTAWQIAEAAGEGHEWAIKLWREYEQATKGARAIELDDRAAAFAADATANARAIDEDVGEVSGDLDAAFANAPTVGEPSVYVELDAELLRYVREYERIDPRATSLWLEAAASPGPLTVRDVEARIDECIRWMIAVCRRFEAAKTRGRDPATFVA